MIFYCNCSHCIEVENLIICDLKRLRVQFVCSVRSEKLSNLYSDHVIIANKGFNSMRDKYNIHVYTVYITSSSKLMQILEERKSLTGIGKFCRAKQSANKKVTEIYSYTYNI